MNIWQKIVVKFKFRFCGFESGMDYLIKLIKNYESSRSVSSGVQKALVFFSIVLAILNKVANLCPTAWTTVFSCILIAVKALVDILSECKASDADISAAMTTVNTAIDCWYKRNV